MNEQVDIDAAVTLAKEVTSPLHPQRVLQLWGSSKYMLLLAKAVIELSEELEEVRGSLRDEAIEQMLRG